MDSYQSAATVAGFLAFDGEADPLGWMIAACQRQKQVLVPIIVARHQPLKFAPWSPGCKMKPNQFGISEPDVSPSRWLEADQLDFVVTPLVAFDRRLNRIGVGGGYYDRTFQFLGDCGIPRRPCLVGCAFDMQQIPRIEPRPWDIPLDGVVTERKVYLR
jgi:5-formyltetrahydrofolate cyclo-ligase